MRHILQSFNDEQVRFKIVFESSCGDELIAAYMANEIKPDICLLSGSVREKNSYQALKEIKLQLPALKVLIVEQEIDDFGVTEMFRNGANGVLKKEVDSAELKTALLATFKTGFYLPGNMMGQIVIAKNAKAGLTEKEMNYLQLLYSNKTCKEIAGILFVGERTVHEYRDRLFDKFDLKTRSRVSLILKAVRMGLLPDNE